MGERINRLVELLNNGKKLSYGIEVYKELIYISLFFTLITIFLTWPLIINLDKFYYNFPENLFDAPLFVFRIHYFGDSILNLYFPIMMTKYYYPDGTNPLIENLVPTYSFLGGSLKILTNLNEVVIFNLMNIFFLVLSCISLYYLIKEFVKNRIASIAGGIVLLSSEYVLSEMFLGHANTIQIFWIIIVLLFIEKIIKKYKIKYGIILGILLSLTFLTTLEYLVYLSIIIPIYIIFRNFKSFYNKNFLKSILIAFIVFILTSSWYMKYFIGKNYEKRTVEENRWNSYGVIDVVKSVFPLLLFTAFCGLIISLKQKLRFIIPFLIIGIFSLIYSFGPFSKLGPLSKIAPQYLLFQYWPYINAFRTPYRMIVFYIIFISISTSVFIKEIYKNKKHLAYLFLIFCIFLVYFTRPTYLTSFYKYPTEKINFYKNISEISGNFSIIEYPNTCNYLYVYNIIFHSKNLIGGCAPHQPYSYISFSQKCNELLNISEDCLGLIKKFNLTYAIYHSNLYQNWSEVNQSLQNSKFLVFERNYDDLFMFKINYTLLKDS